MLIFPELYFNRLRIRNQFDDKQNKNVLQFYKLLQTLIITIN
jgi:hypothetical protein